MVKTSTYSPKVRPINSKTIIRSSVNSHDKTSNITSNAIYSKSVDAKYFAQAFDYNNSKLSPRDNSAVLRAVSASTSANNTTCFATATRLNKYRYQHPAYESHEMFEQQTQPQQEPKQQNTFGKYEKICSNCIVEKNCSSSSSTKTCADDSEMNQMVVITLNGANATSAQKQVK